MPLTDARRTLAAVMLATVCEALDWASVMTSPASMATMPDADAISPSVTRPPVALTHTLPSALTCDRPRNTTLATACR